MWGGVRSHQSIQFNQILPSPILTSSPNDTFDSHQSIQFNQTLPSPILTNSPNDTLNSHQARYCGREHQVEDWKGKGGHKASCGQFSFLRACAEGTERLDRRDVVVK